jgi:hypothetical protein
MLEVSLVFGADVSTQSRAGDDVVPSWVAEDPPDREELAKIQHAIDESELPWTRALTVETLILEAAEGRVDGNDRHAWVDEGAMPPRRTQCFLILSRTVEKN